MEFVRTTTVFIINKEYPAVNLGKRVCELTGIKAGDTVEVYRNGEDVVLRKRTDMAGTIAEMRVPVMEGEGK